MIAIVLTTTLALATDSNDKNASGLSPVAREIIALAVFLP
jgi:hypothetical protein